METRHHAEASRGVHRGRLTACKSATCRSLGSASVAGLFGRRHRAGLLSSRRPLSAPGAGGCMGDSARSGVRASEPRTLSERSEPDQPAQRTKSAEGLPIAAGLGRREAQAKEFFINHLVFRKAPVQWKTFCKARVSRGLLPFGAGLGRREAQKNRRPVQGGEPCPGPGREPWPPAATARAAAYAARRSGRKWAVISSNHGCRWMA
jgi:hypothetical protein